MSVVNRLFVYGTLAPGKKNEHILKPFSGSWEKGFVRGTLIKAGWGADFGCPGIKLHKSSNFVEGLIFTSDQLSLNWHYLDEFEGKDYKRVITEANNENNDTILVHIYQLS